MYLINIFLKTNKNKHPILKDCELFYNFMNVNMIFKYWPLVVVTIAFTISGNICSPNVGVVIFKHVAFMHYFFVCVTRNDGRI